MQTSAIENFSHFEKNAVTLEQLPPGESARISAIGGEPGLRARMLALGLRSGREVVVVRRARLGGPLHIRIGTTDLMMRRSEARLVELATASTGAA
jgi:ferrous iron transport protein A